MNDPQNDAARVSNPLADLVEQEHKKERQPKILKENCFAKVTPIFFIAKCPACESQNEFRLTELGQSVSCTVCDRVYQAADNELESAALDENISHFAKTLDWPKDELPFTQRPR